MNRHSFFSLEIHHKWHVINETEYPEGFVSPEIVVPYQLWQKCYHLPRKFMIKLICGYFWHYAIVLTALYMLWFVLCEGISSYSLCFSECLCLGNVFSRPSSFIVISIVRNMMLISWIGNAPRHWMWSFAYVKSAVSCSLGISCYRSSSRGRHVVFVLF